jgi:hypothetical protein
VSRSDVPMLIPERHGDLNRSFMTLTTGAGCRDCASLREGRMPADKFGAARSLLDRGSMWL